MQAASSYAIYAPPFSPCNLFLTNQSASYDRTVKSGGSGETAAWSDKMLFSFAP